MFNLEPDKEALFRGSRASVVSTVLFLLVLAGAVFPVGFAVSRWVWPLSICVIVDGGRRELVFMFRLLHGGVCDYLLPHCTCL